MPVSFQTVLPTIQRKVAEDATLRAQLLARVEAVTVVRDATGLVRFLVEPVQGEELKEEDPGLSQLRTVAARELGAYFGNDIWFTKKHFAVLGTIINVVRKDRVPASWDASHASPRWYLVERHVGKHLWTGRVDRQTPWPVEPVEMGRQPAVVTFFSYKGGIGRTTSLAGTAIALARKGHRVAIVDLDLEAPGLSTLFSLASPDDLGVLDYLIEKRVQKNAWPLRPCVRQINDPGVVGPAGEPVRLLPAGTVDSNYLEKLARVDFQHLTEASSSAILVGMIRELNAAAQPLDFIFLDARAGFHDLGGFALSALSHGAVLLAAHSRQNWAGVAYAVELSARPSKEDRLPVVLVHGMAPPLGTPGREQTMKEFRDRAYDVFQEHYYGDDEVIPNANDTDAPFAPIELLWQAELRGDILLAPRDDTQAERERVDMLATLLSRSCEPIAEKVCRLFGRSFDRGEVQSG